MLPDPFFAGPGLDRADALRCQPERIAALAGRSEARQLVWDNGAPALGEDGRLRWTAERPSEPAFATVHHGFTHFTLDLHLVARVEPAGGEGWWQPLDRIGEAGLPTLYRRAAEAGLAEEKFAA